LLQCNEDDGCGCKKKHVLKGKTIETFAPVQAEVTHFLNQIKGKAPMAHCQPWFITADTMIRNMVGNIRAMMVKEATARCSIKWKAAGTKKKEKKKEIATLPPKKVPKTSGYADDGGYSEGSKKDGGYGSKKDGGYGSKTDRGYGSW